MPAKGFATNPGVWKPDLNKYSKGVKDELEKELKNREDEVKRRELDLLPDCDWIEKPSFTSISKAIEFAQEVKKSTKKECLKKLPNQKNYKSYGLINSKYIAEENKAIKPEMIEPAETKDKASDKIKNNIMGESTKRLIKTPFQTVEFDEGNAVHIAKDRKIRRERYSNFFVPTLEEPDEMWMTKYDDGIERVTYIKYYKNTDGTNLQAVVSHNESKVKEYLITIIPKKYKSVNNNRIGELYYVKRHLIKDVDVNDKFKNDIIIED